VARNPTTFITTSTIPTTLVGGEPRPSLDSTHERFRRNGHNPAGHTLSLRPCLKQAPAGRHPVAQTRSHGISSLPEPFHRQRTVASNKVSRLGRVGRRRTVP